MLVVLLPLSCALVGLGSVEELVQPGDGGIGKHVGSIKKDSITLVERSVAVASIRIGYNIMVLWSMY